MPSHCQLAKISRPPPQQMATGANSEWKVPNWDDWPQRCRGIPSLLVPRRTCPASANSSVHFLHCPDLLISLRSTPHSARVTRDDGHLPVRVWSTSNRSFSVAEFFPDQKNLTSTSLDTPCTQFKVSTFATKFIIIMSQRRLHSDGV